MKTYFTKLALLAAAVMLAFAGVKSKADSIASAVAAGTPLTLLSNNVERIESIVFINTNAATQATLYFYDSDASDTRAGAQTNYVVSATTTYAKLWRTNTRIFTNSSGLLVTNIAYGYSNVATTVAASTNERTRILTMVVPAANSLTLTDVGIVPSLGFTVYSTAAGTINVTYSNNR